MKYFAIIAALLFGAPAFAQSLFPPVAGLLIVQPSGPWNGGTSAAANWRVSNYNPPPGFNLGNFGPAPWGGYLAISQGASGYPMERVTYNPAANRDEIYQDGKTLPCSFAYTGGTQVDEWDLFISPDSVTFYPPLSALSHLYMAGAVQAWGYPASGPVCPVTVGVVSDALTIWDATTSQNFYEQFALVKFDASGNVIPLSVQKDVGWFATGKNGQTAASSTFGHNNGLSLMGMPAVITGKPQAFNVDILAAIKADIAAGAAYGMDQNLAHWQVSGGFAGGSVWGPVALRARLGGMALNAVVAP